MPLTFTHVQRCQPLRVRKCRTQNPPGASPCRFESDPGHHLPSSASSHSHHVTGAASACVSVQRPTLPGVAPVLFLTDCAASHTSPEQRRAVACSPSLRCVTVPLSSFTSFPLRRGKQTRIGQPYLHTAALTSGFPRWLGSNARAKGCCKASSRVGGPGTGVAPGQGEFISVGGGCDAVAGRNPLRAVASGRRKERGMVRPAPPFSRGRSPSCQSRFIPAAPKNPDLLAGGPSFIGGVA